MVGWGRGLELVNSFIFFTMNPNLFIFFYYYYEFVIKFSRKVFKLGT